jgi:uncharacterized RDD family membrane protein YckC
MSTKVSFILFDSSSVRPIGSLWSRILAFIVDSFILYIVGRIVGAAFFDTLSMLGLWGRAFGFCIALVYFVSLESRVGGGQTLGKRLFRLRVVNAQGDMITWKRATIRYMICAIPFFLIEPRYTMSYITLGVSALITFIELGVGGASLYLLVFNRRTRQGLHDVAVGTYVVESSVSGPLQTKPIWGLHWSVIGSFWLLIAFAYLSKGITTDWQHKSAYISQYLQEEQLIANLGGVQTDRVRIFMPIPLDGSALGNLVPKKRNAIVTVQWDKATASRETFADQVAGIILKSDPRAQKEDSIQIRIGRSYDLVISSGNDYQYFTHTPAEWSQRVLGASPAPNTSPVHP